MTKRRLTVLLCSLLLAACGGGDDDVPFDAPAIDGPRDAPLLDAPIIDAPDIDAPLPIDGPQLIDAPIDASTTCDPLAPAGVQGCQAGQKCTWVRIQETPVLIGVTACVPDGTVTVGGACLVGPAGETTGFDNCAAGGVCVTGQCLDICGFDGSPNAACASGSACARYSGIFDDGVGSQSVGACAATCDPITQLRPNGSTCGANLGCYLLVNQIDTVSVCANAGTIAHGQEIIGTPFANSCVPGAQPRRRSGAAQINECGGLCRPADVTSTTNMAAEGGVAPNSCTTRWGAPAPDNATQGESCRYWWAREGAPGLTAFSNTVGWCFPHAEFLYDTNNDQVADAPFPRCIVTTTGDTLPPFGAGADNDALYFWCIASPSMFQLLLGAPPPRPPSAQPQPGVLQL